jgi:hypothetical protein
LADFDSKHWYPDPPFRWNIILSKAKGEGGIRIPQETEGGPLPVAITSLQMTTPSISTEPQTLACARMENFGAAEKMNFHDNINS